MVYCNCIFLMCLMKDYFKLGITKLRNDEQAGTGFLYKHIAYMGFPF